MLIGTLPYLSMFRTFIVQTSIQRCPMPTSFFRTIASIKPKFTHCVTAQQRIARGTIDLNTTMKWKGMYVCDRASLPLTQRHLTVQAFRIFIFLLLGSIQFSSAFPLCTRVFPLLSTIALAAPTIADGTFRSRPDLSPPQLNVTIECSGRCETGFLFVAPFVGYADLSDHGPLQSGAYILTDSGDLVWSGFTYFSIWTGNFQAARWKGQEILYAFEGAHNGLHGHGHGHHTILNQHYQTIRELRAGNHLLSDKHEFINLDEKTALFQIHHPLQTYLASYGGTNDQSWIVDAIFQGRLRLCGQE